MDTQGKNWREGRRFAIEGFLMKSSRKGAKGTAWSFLFGVFFPLWKDKANVQEHFKTGAKVDLRLVLQDSDNEERGIPFKIDSFYRVCLPAFLEKGNEALFHIFDIFWFYIFQDVYVDKIPLEIRKEPVVIKDDLETVIRCIVNGHKSSIHLLLRGDAGH